MSFNAQALMPLLYIGFSLIAPLVPALAIYRLLPMSDTHVSGPFKGLQIKLGGAFAGYFLLVLLSVTFIRMSPAPPNYEVWEIQGKFRLDPPAEIESGKHPISIIPPFARIDSDGRFKVLVAVPRDHNGEPDFPGLSVEYGDEYNKVPVPLYELAKSSRASVTVGADNNTIVLECDNAAKRIRLDSEVVLPRKAAAKEEYLKNKNDTVVPMQIKLGGAEGQP